MSISIYVDKPFLNRQNSLNTLDVTQLYYFGFGPAHYLYVTYNHINKYYMLKGNGFQKFFTNPVYNSFDYTYVKNLSLNVIEFHFKRIISEYFDTFHITDREVLNELF